MLGEVSDLKVTVMASLTNNQGALFEAFPSDVGVASGVEETLHVWQDSIDYGQSSKGETIETRSNAFLSHRCACVNR